MTDRIFLTLLLGQYSERETTSRISVNIIMNKKREERGLILDNHLNSEMLCEHTYWVFREVSTHLNDSLNTELMFDHFLKDVL